LVPYLFGASPAVCKSFFVGKATNLPSFDDTTYFAPHATSLRMGDIGYQNSREEGLGLKACYDDLYSYADSLLTATMTPAETWEAIGLRSGGEYRQLTAHILQIENEYYSTVRPKQVLRGFEKPSLALKQRGIGYVELRSLDVNAYHPLGLDEIQGRFLEVFMLFCLLTDSPLIDDCERREIDRNLLDVAHRGREPKLALQHRGVRLPMRAWALEILESMLPICETLDAIDGGAWFEDAIDDQIAKVRAPDLTPSGRMLDEMRDKGEGFYSSPAACHTSTSATFSNVSWRRKRSRHSMPRRPGRWPSRNGSRRSRRSISTVFSPTTRRRLDADRDIPGGVSCLALIVSDGPSAQP